MKTNDKWLAYRESKIEDFYAAGGELTPDPKCNTCDVCNDYICFFFANANNWRI
jgi:hypothetical protein